MDTNEAPANAMDGCIFLTCATLGRYLINRLKFGVSAF
jgi:hypothetical protein